MRIAGNADNVSLASIADLLAERILAGPLLAREGLADDDGVLLAGMKVRPVLSGIPMVAKKPGSTQLGYSTTMRPLISVWLFDTVWPRGGSFTRDTAVTPGTARRRFCIWSR